MAWAEPPDLAWAGWPNGIARLSDCEITYLCTDGEHLAEVAVWSRLGADSRAVRVLRLYGTALGEAVDG